MTTIEWTSRSPDETESLARRVAGDLRSGDVVTLSGDLGAGKTTFVRGVHAGRRARGRPRSPSFTTLNVYEGEVPLHHFDLFRYDAVGPAFLDEFAEWLEPPAIVLIEWPERMGRWLPADRLDVALATGEAVERRTITLTATSPAWSARLAGWSAS